MWAEWNDIKVETPEDKTLYLIEQDVISFTEKILKEYGNKEPSHEGFVYWAGRKKENEILINSAVAPQAESDPYHITVPHEGTYDFVKVLSANNIVQIAQVHTHPDSRVAHSPGDNLAGFRLNGLLSIVVPNYGLRGIQLFDTCGVHRYNKGKFLRLSTKYCRHHFQVTTAGAKVILDLRNK